LTLACSAGVAAAAAVAEGTFGGGDRSVIGDEEGHMHAGATFEDVVVDRNLEILSTFWRHDTCRYNDTRNENKNKTQHIDTLC
jgi:hypothetical protein